MTHRRPPDDRGAALEAARVPGVRAGDRRRAAVRGRRDPQAGHVPDLGQRPQHAHAGERHRRARDRHDVRDRDGGHRPLGRLDGRRRRRLRRHPARRRGHQHARLHRGGGRLRDAARHDQRDRGRLRARRAVHRDARDVLDRQGHRPAAQRQAAGQPARPQRRLLRRPRGPSRCSGSATGGSSGSRYRSTSSSRSRSPAGCCSTARATAATSWRSAATARRRGSPACRSGETIFSVYVLLGLLAGIADRAALRAPRQRLAGQRQPLRARRDRRRRDRRHEPRRRPRDASSGRSSAS